MKKYLISGFIIIAYTIFAVSSFYFKIEVGQKSVSNLLNFLRHMVLLLPFAFILIGLFEVWVKKEVIIRHLGVETGFLAYFWAILLAGTTIGGLYVAFPFAYSLHKKGAKLGVVFTYLACAGILRIPMTVFEASFLGLKFTVIRFMVSLPLVVLSSWLMGEFLQKRNYALVEPNVPKKKRK